MMNQTTFSEILEAASNLPSEEQENLINILQNRLRDQRRSEIIKGVQEAQQEFAQGQGLTTALIQAGIPPEDIMNGLSLETA